MTATHMKTPVGDIPIRESIRKEMATMTDRQIADKALRDAPHINPEYFAELCHRGLCGPGVYRKDVYRMIQEREMARCQSKK